MKSFLNLLWIVIFIMIGCATNTISSVPDIDVGKITKPKFEMLKERSIALTLEDNRSEKYRLEPAKWNEKILAVLHETFEQSGIRIDEKSKNHLIMTVKDTTLPGQDATDCVEIKSTLKSKPYSIEISGTACSSYRSSGGGHLDSDIGRAYEMALSMDFGGIDQKFEEIRKTR